MTLHYHDPASIAQSSWLVWMQHTWCEGSSYHCTSSGTECYGMPGHQRHQIAFLWDLFIISPFPVPWAASWDVGTHQISQRPEWRPQTVIMLIWGGMRWPRYKSSAAWGTVERVWSGIRAVTDPSEAICETHFPKNWCSGAKDPSSQTCEQSWNPAAGSLSVGACLSLSLFCLALIITPCLQDHCPPVKLDWKWADGLMVSGVGKWHAYAPF